MADPAFIRSRCSTGPAVQELPAYLAPAIAWLRMKHGGIFHVVQNVPPRLLPRLVQAAAERNVDSAIMRDLVKVVGADNLCRAIGRKPAAAIPKRYA